MDPEKYNVIMDFFTYDHLPDSEMRRVSKECAELAISMESTIASDPELSEGLRKLLEAKDCFVRAKLRQIRG